jgi:hypothetical protein
MVAGRRTVLSAEHVRDTPKVVFGQIFIRNAIQSVRSSQVPACLCGIATEHWGECAIPLCLTVSGIIVPLNSVQARTYQY